MRKGLSILLLASFLAVLVSACGGPAEPPQVSAQPKVFRFSDTYDVKSLNGQNDVDTLVHDVLLYTHSSLYRRVPSADGKAAIYIGDLADGDPECLDDGYTWRIKLRKEAKWHNGEPINADTMMYTFKMLLDPLLSNAMANFLYDREIKIKNGFEYYTQAQEGKSPVAWEDVGIKKIDDYTLEIITTQRYRAEDVKRHFTDRSLFPVYEPLYEAGMNESRTVTTYGASLDQYMGCGPYFFESWNPDANRVYVKNPDHWLADYFHFDRVEVRITPDRNARVQMWENGEIDVMGLDSSTLDTYRDDPRTRRYNGITIQHIDINSLHTKNPILRTMNFRKAMYWAMDRETIAELMGATPAPYYINTQAGAYPEKGITYRMTEEAKALIPPNNGYDPEKAREYFEAALAEIGQDSVTVELMYNDSNVGRKLIGEYLQQHLPEVFGKDKFTLNLRAVPTSSYDAMTDFRTAGPDCFEMAFSGWASSLSRVYPYAAMQYFVDSYRARPNSFISEDFDRQFAACQEEEVRLNPELMVKMTAELEALYLRDVINVPLYDTVSYTMYSERMVLPCSEYIPGFGFGTMFADIVE
ncbi:MAG: peptide ABC transporter substrate-binding protein [Bacillota bacterium]